MTQLFGYNVLSAKLYLRQTIGNVTKATCSHQEDLDDNESLFVDVCYENCLVIFTIQ